MEPMGEAMGEPMSEAMCEPMSEPMSEVDRSARSYVSQPGLYPTATPGPDGARHLSSPNLPLMLPQLPESVARAMGMAGGSQHIPPLQFASQAGSSSGPAHAALPGGTQPIPWGHQGYGGAPGSQSGGAAYPHYDPAQDPELDVDLHPHNRLLYLGMAVLLIGVIVLLARLVSDNDEPPAPPRTAPMTESTATGGQEPALLPEPAKHEAAAPGPASPSRLTPSQVTQPVAALDAGAPAVSDDSISLHVVSAPEGAEVTLFGKPIGVTPLDVRIKRATGLATLTLHRARFQDATTTVDLSGDCSRQLTLIPVADEQTVRPPGRPGGRDRPTPGQPSPGRPRPVPAPPAAPPAPPPPPPAPAPAKSCQDPGQLNPFDKSCDGQPCPPCPSK